MRRWGDESKRVRARIEVIPMIDVMMFLLVFFVLISINVIPAFGLKTRLPVAESAQTNANRHSVVLAIGRDGQLQLDGIPVTTEALVSHL